LPEPYKGDKVKKVTKEEENREILLLSFSFSSFRREWRR